MEYYQKAVYKSPIWNRLRKEVIKRDKDICYFCGKLILKRRTIHHLIEIDETNYSNPEIAFNLDNLVECHAECHDIHHERFSKQTIVDPFTLEINYEKRGKKWELKYLLLNTNYQSQKGE